MMRRIPPISSNQLLAYMIVGIFTFMLWGIAYLVWREAYRWFLFVTEPTFFLTLFVLPIPYLVYQNFMRPAGTGGPPRSLWSWAIEWLRWMGNGETHRGTLVLLVCVFWTMLYWNWPQPDVRSFPLALTFPAWGLLTIFGLVAIRQLLFQHAPVTPPSQEVSAPEAKKSAPQS